MATPESIAIRKAEAQERMVKAAEKLAKLASIEGEIDLAPAHKDLAIQGAIQVEAIADFLESLVKGKGDAPKQPASATNEDAALAQGEATALAEKLEATADKPSAHPHSIAGAPGSKN